jgi:hypothetical protein
MKKHAFLVGAYKKPDYLLSLIDSLDSEKSNIYIHINKNNDNEFQTFKQKIANRPNIHYFSVVPVQWGGITMIQSQLFLCKEALKDSENEYFHFITGQDVLIKPLNSFFEFIESSDNSYISYGLLDKKELDYRFNYYHLFDTFNITYAKISFGRLLEWLLSHFQMIIRLRYEELPFDTIYKGSPWCSLQRKALKYCVNELTEKKCYLKRFRYTFAPDESLFHSLLLSSHNFPIINDNLRYIIWDKSYVGGQKLLTEDDFEILVESNDFFARKVDPSDAKSAALIEKLTHYLHRS